MLLLSLDVSDPLLMGIGLSFTSSSVAIPDSAVVQTPVFLDNLLSNFDLSSHPVTTILASYCLVTAADMVPFVPCQPLAIALGAKLGFNLAFPITAIGQTTAGVLAFSAARRAADSDIAQQTAVTKLSPEALEKSDPLWPARGPLQTCQPHCPACRSAPAGNTRLPGHDEGVAPRPTPPAETNAGQQRQWRSR